MVAENIYGKILSYNPAIERGAAQAAFLRAIRLVRRPSFLRWAPSICAYHFAHESDYFL